MSNVTPTTTDAPQGPQDVDAEAVAYGGERPDVGLLAHLPAFLRRAPRALRACTEPVAGWDVDSLEATEGDDEARNDLAAMHEDWRRYREVLEEIGVIPTWEHQLAHSAGWVASHEHGRARRFGR